MSEPASEDVSEKQAYRELAHVLRVGGNRRFRYQGLSEFGWRLASANLRAYIELVLGTSKPRLIDPWGMIAKMVAGESVMTAGWHRNIIGMLLTSREWVSRSVVTNAVRCVVSESKDGEIIARLYRDLGGSGIRGSASRSGAGALADMIADLKSGGSFAITPDGPKGPPEIPKDGVLMAAAKSGQPIYPFAAHFSKKLVFKGSWDQTAMPIPFGRITIIVGRPVAIPNDTNKEALDVARERLTLAINAVQARADRLPTRVWGIGKERKKRK